MGCCQSTRPQVHGHRVRSPACAPRPRAGPGAGVRGPGWREDRAGRPRAPPSGLSEPQGPRPSIREETKRLFPLIWFYRDSMLTLNFECFYLFQSLIPFWGGDSWARAANNLLPRASRTRGHRDRQIWKLEGAGRRWSQHPPTCTRNSPSVSPFPTRSPGYPLSPLARQAALRKAGAGGGCAVQEWRTDQGSGRQAQGAELHRNWAPPPPRLGPPSAAPIPMPRG